MRLYEVGQQLRTLRESKGFTQAQLASLAGITRSTLNRLENGAENDIGVKKLSTLLECLGAELTVANRPRRTAPDYIARAVGAANVSAGTRLHADELAQAVLTGRPAPGKAGLIQLALEELSGENREGLLRQIAGGQRDPERANDGLRRLERTLGDAAG
jgi:transcriptional regulator with XRE-family HTH domain